MAISPNRRGGAPVALLLIIGIAAAGAIAWYVYNRSGPPAPAAAVLTPEAREYIRQGGLKLADVDMSAKENFAGGMLVEITGNITNAGGRNIRLVEITCVFTDPSGLVVLRERVPIVSAKMGGLKPGETKRFRLPFDTIPESWNQALPQLVIAQIVFGS
jgi:hypothetical protein